MTAMSLMIAGVGCVGVLLISSLAEGRGVGSQVEEVSYASQYGQAHEGWKTTSGARFSQSQLTATHRSLPLGTKVWVTNLRTRQ